MLHWIRIIAAVAFIAVTAAAAQFDAGGEIRAAETVLGWRLRKVRLGQLSDCRAEPSK